MDFIEQMFGLYPDAGNGALELSLVAIVLTVVALSLSWRRAIKQNARGAGRRIAP